MIQREKMPVIRKCFINVLETEEKTSVALGIFPALAAVIEGWYTRS